MPGGLGRAAADAELEPTAGQQVRRRRGLGHVERVLVAHVDHAGADLDPAGLDADRGEERKRRGELAGEMVDTDERPVDTDLLRCDRKLHRLVQRVAGGVSQPAARVPGAEREKADPLRVCHRSTQRCCLVEHSGRYTSAVTPRPGRPRLAVFRRLPCRVRDSELSVFGVILYERLDERADRDNLEASFAGVVEGLSDECRAEAAPLSLWVDLGVEKREYAAATIAEDEFAGVLAVEKEDVAALRLFELNGDIGHALLQERRRWDAGRAVNLIEDERDLVHVAPAPVLSWLE